MPTPNMGLTLPIDHDSADQWDVILDTVFGLIDAHTHAPGLGVKVPVAGLNINADISWASGGSQFAITDLRAIDFSPQAAAGMASLAGALFLNSADNDLYYRTFGGVNIRVTAGGVLNVASVTGGIGGDYAAVGALVTFDDATDSYWFQQQVGAAVRQYARMRTSDLELFEYKAHPAAGPPANRVRLASPAALAASYVVTWPGAVPASTQLVQMDSAGTLTATNTVAQLITASLGLTAAVNQHITVSGTGEYKHGDRTKTLSAFACIVQSGWTPVAGAAGYMTSGGAALMLLVLPLKIGDRIKSVSFMLFGDGAADITTTVRSYDATMTATSLGAVTTSNQPAAWSAITLAVTNTVVATNTSVQVEFNANAINLRVGSIQYTYDHP